MYDEQISEPGAPAHEPASLRKTSTGPRTPEGKEISSRNAADHGLSCARFFLIPGESEQEFNALKNAWTSEYKQFASPILDRLLKNVIEADWLQQRAYKKAFESELALATAEQNRDTPDRIEEIFKRLQLIQRYKTAYENSYQRAFRAIEAFRKSRSSERLLEARLGQIKTYAVTSINQQFHRLVKELGMTKDDAHAHLTGQYAVLQHTLEPSPPSSPGT